MLVTMLQSISGPSVSCGVGDTAEWPDAEAKSLIAAGIAEPMKAKPETAEAAKPETATVPSGKREKRA